MRKLSFALVLIAGSAFAQQPRIDSITPSHGPIVGGTVVTVSGAGFGGATLSLDDVPIAPSSRTDTEIRFTTPAHDNGYAVVEIGSASAEFLYVPPRLQDLPAGFITTVAGVGQRVGLNRPAKQANVHPHGIALSSSGAVYFGDAYSGYIFRIDESGLLRAVTGGFHSSDTDGRPAGETYISGPRSIAFDAAGNLYVAEQGSHRLHRIDGTTGIVTTLCGTGVAGFSGDGGPATQATINEGNYLTAAPDGTVYFLDFNNARIRRITPGGIITTIAGTGVSGSDGDGGPATAARLEMRPNDTDAGAIALDSRAGILYYGETHSGRIRRIDLATNIITTLLTLPSDSDDGREWPQIRSIAVDAAGDLYVGVFTQIIKIGSDGHTIATWGKHKEDGFSVDGTTLADLQLGEAIGLALDHEGNLLFSDGLIGRLRRMNFGNTTVETVAGTAPAIYGVPGSAYGAVLDGFLSDLAFLPNGDLLYSDAVSLYVFRIDPAGNITTVGGSGSFFGGGWFDRPVLGANFGPVCIQPDDAGGYYFSDTGSIGYVDPAGVGHIVAGASQGFSGDGGPAIAAGLLQPWDVARDSAGNLYIADTNNNRVRKIDKATGIITTIAGSGAGNGLEGYGHGSYCGDGGPAIEACLNSPSSVAVDPNGNVFVSDLYNQRLRRIDTNGMITTFAARPTSQLAIDANGVVFAVASGSVDRYRPDGRRVSLAGEAVPFGFSGDGGPAAAAAMNSGGLGVGIALDAEGNLFFRDGGNSRIRAVRFGAVLAPTGAAARSGQGSQSVGVSRTLATPLEVIVTDADGGPSPSVRVDFTAPTSAASCVFTNGARTASALTDRNGRARVSATATCAPGAYTITATPLTSAERPAISVSFSLTNGGSNAVSRIDSLMPAAAFAGTNGLTISLHGADFSPCSLVRWNGADRPTTFVSMEELRVTIPAADLATPRSFQITTFTPQPGGGVSNGATFIVGGRRRAARK